MNEKILWVEREKKYYSYIDVYSYKNKDILGPINELISKGDNVIHCMCHGKSSNKPVKMHTRKQENGLYYSLATNKAAKVKHKFTCPKYNEDETKKQLILKGRIYSEVSMELNIPLREDKIAFLNKSNVFKPNEKYSTLYGVGEMLLTSANNLYIDKYKKIGTEHNILKTLFGYYDNGSNQKINTYLNDVVVDKKGQLLLGDIIFNPKWIKCDEKVDKTATVIKSYNEINKRNKFSGDLIKQYILLKYKGYSVVEDNLVKLELYARGKNTKSNYDKSIFVYMNKFDFFKNFNMYKLSDVNCEAEYYISALVYLNNDKLFIDQMAFIPVYPGYCIPVDTIDDIQTISQLLKWRDKITIKKVAKMDHSFDATFNGVIPDFIIEVKGKSTPILLESFDLVIKEYFDEMIAKTVKYEQLVKEGKCEFIGFYRNIGWGNPPLSAILSPNFKTMDNISKKVKNGINKVF